MPRIRIKTEFSFSDNGYTLVPYTAVGQVVEVSEECARVALTEGWATAGDQPEEVQAHAAAPENKAAGRKVRAPAKE